MKNLTYIALAAVVLSTGSLFAQSDLRAPQPPRFTEPAPVRAQTPPHDGEKYTLSVADLDDETLYRMTEVNGLTVVVTDDWLQDDPTKWMATRGRMFIGYGLGGTNGPGFFGDAELNFSGDPGKKINLYDGYEKSIQADANNLQIVNVEPGDWNTVTTMQIDTGTSSRFRVINHDSLEHFTVLGRSGNVGVGTSAPSERLEVQGNLKLSGNLITTGDICIGQCSGI